MFTQQLAWDRRGFFNYYCLMMQKHGWPLTGFLSNGKIISKLCRLFRIQDSRFQSGATVYRDKVSETCVKLSWGESSTPPKAPCLHTHLSSFRPVS